MKKLSSTLALVVFLPSLVACGAVEDPNTPVDEAEMESEDMYDAQDPVLPGPKFLPERCGAIADHDPDAVDGEFTLYVGGDESKPWTAYCHELWNGGATFLPLPAQAPGKNTSMYKAGGASPGTDVVTVYLKVRIDPTTMMIDISDQTFAVSSGLLNHAGGPLVSSMPFGVAMGCDDAAAIATANIDLSGTPFAIDDLFATHGAGSAGSGVFSSDSRAVDLTGQGFCGWTAPELAPFNPINDAGDYALVVKYQK